MELAERKQELTQQVEALRLEDEVATLESEVRVRKYIRQQNEAAVLSESTAVIGLYNNDNFVDPRVWQTDSFGRIYSPHNSWGTREDGKYRPFIETEQDLATMRSVARYVVETNLYARGLMEDLTNFVIGTGLKFLVKPKDTDNRNKQLNDALQDVVDRFVENNNISGEIDREAFFRSRRDGETFLRIHHVGNGDCILRIPEPEFFIEPGDKDRLTDWLIRQNPAAPYARFPSCWTFGIHTNDNDISTRWGYFLEWEQAGDRWEYVPAHDIIHIKENTDSNVKRGLSDFYPVNHVLRKAGKLLTTAIDGAAFQSSIGIVTEYEQGVTGEGVARMQAANASRTVTNSTTSQTEYIQDFDGTVINLHSPAGRKYNAGPLGTPQGPVYMEVLQGALRAVAARWSMPEHMISSDASNNNYASILEAGSPFKKSIEAAQAKFSKRMATMIWTAVGYAVHYGSLGQHGYSLQDFKRLFEIDVECPTPEVAERKEETERKMEMVDRGIISKDTVAAEDGYDYETEQANIQNTKQVSESWEKLFKGYP